MKIESSNASLYSHSTFQYQHQTTSSTQLQYGRSDNNQENENSLKSQAFVLDFNFSQTTTIDSNRVFYNSEENMSFEDRIKKMLIEKLLGELYGKDISIPFHPQKNQPTQQDTNQQIFNPYKQNEKDTQNTQNQELIGIVFNQTHKYYQKQTVDFSASVQINTPNRSFDIDLSISYSQELYELHSSKLVIGKEAVLDPLVINYGEDVNPFENLSRLKFEFDLNNDGKDDLIPLLKKGAGYLALDKNQNGTIDNGSELFGTKSGDGFKDLSIYDKDKNNWIDENDDIFNNLKVWQKDDQNEGKLISLIDLNIGAIYLGDVQSGFKYQNSINNTDAIQKSNGIFIKEDGSGAGVVNSIDIVI